ncbi:MAG: hypothetical protein HW385_1259 [candidate division NC10 bacterium]|nr:hypothetical protein [candidate division NC10 bacterium]
MPELQRRGRDAPGELPGLNPVTSDIVILGGLPGMSYPDLIGHVVTEAIGRHPALHGK